MAKHSDDPNQFMHAVGQALTAWGKVEASLCALFSCAASGTETNEALECAFWAITSFDVKLRAVDAAMRKVFSEHTGYISIWNDLHKSLDRNNRKRNEIAHGSIIPLSVPDKNGGHIEVKFVPFFWSRLGTITVKNGNFDAGFSLKDIREFAEDFSEVEIGLWKFRDLYLKEQIVPRSTKRSDGSLELPQFHLPKSVTPTK